MREILGGNGILSRSTYGGLIFFHYVYSAADRWQRRMGPWSRSAPIVAAATTFVFTAAPTSLIGVMLAAFATFSYGAGYFSDEVWGRREFGIPLMICGFLGDALIAFTDHPLWGQPLLVAAGIIAGARSITAFFKGAETRRPPDPPEQDAKLLTACQLRKR